MGRSFVARLREILPFEDVHRNRMIEESRELIFASVTSSLVAAAAHGCWRFGVRSHGNERAGLLGRDDGFFLARAGGGSALIWVPAAISLMLGGHVVKAYSGFGVQRGCGIGRQYDPAVADQRARAMGGLGYFYQRAGRNRRIWNARNRAGTDRRGHGCQPARSLRAEACWKKPRASNREWEEHERRARVAPSAATDDHR